MTTLDSITVSLENAKRLKEAGWPQGESHFAFVFSGINSNMVRVELADWVCSVCKDPHDRLAAPTAEEILRRLPRSIQNAHGYLYLQIELYGINGWCVMYEKDSPPFNNPESICLDSEDSLANAAAAMFCYLAENKLLPSA